MNEEPGDTVDGTKKSRRFIGTFCFAKPLIKLSLHALSCFQHDALPLVLQLVLENLRLLSKRNLSKIQNRSLFEYSLIVVFCHLFNFVVNPAILMIGDGSHP